MIPTRELLRLPPWEALIEAVNYHLQLTLDARSTRLVELDLLTDDRIEVTLAFNTSTSLRNLLPPTQQITVVYQRLDIGRFFGYALVLPPDTVFPSTVELTKYITQRTGVVFDKDDVIHEMIPVGSSPYQLQAHPRSLRWVGTLTINLN